MHMDYTVEFVTDAELPAGHDWAVFRTEGHKVLAIKEDRVCPEVIADIWEAYDQMNGLVEGQEIRARA